MNPGTNQFTDTGFFYDASGNMTQDGNYTYTFDAENHITSASGMSGGPWYYVYDGLGLRVAKCSNPNHTTASCTAANSPTGGTLYWRSISGDSLAETDLSGSTSNAAASEYVFFAGRRIAIRNGGTGAVNYIYADQLGSTVSVTDASGNSCYAASFTPYGEEHASVTSTCANTNNYKFTGYERDPETGLDYAFARYYNYRLARFMSADPLAGSVLDPQSLNRYAYVGNNPTNFTDPAGLFKACLSRNPAVCFYQNWDMGGGNIGGGLTYLYIFLTTEYWGYGNDGPQLFTESTFVPIGEFSWLSGSGGDGGASQVNVKALADCIMSLFGVGTVSFSSSEPGANGSFTGDKAGVFTGANSPDVPGPYVFSVTNDVSKSSTTLSAIYVQSGHRLGPDEQLGGMSTTANPFVNYSASNLPTELVNTQMFELGNSLAIITHALPANMDTSIGPSNTEPGTSLTDCYKKATQAK